MKAVILQEPGEPENLIVKNIDKPEIKENEVLVRIHAISINPVDIKTRNGKAMYGQIKDHQPIVLGWDISGEIEQVGKDVKKFKKGDLVFGMVNFPGHGKAYAEYVAAPEEHLAIKPDNITHTEAAATTLAALTAWQVLVNESNIKAGQKILIHAAAGGVGHFAVQIAKFMGSTVIGTASAKNSTFLKELGVDKHIDYTKEDFEEGVNEADIVLDPIGGETTLKSVNIVKNGGKIVSIVGGAKDEVLKRAEQKNVDATNYLVHSSGEDMNKIAGLLKTGAIKPQVSHAFSFTDIASAHRQIETGKTRGKIVVII